MKHIILFLIVFLTSTFGPLTADERIGGTLEHVDLFIEDLINDEGHNYGEKYFVLNRGDVPMRVSIKLTDAENAEDHLINHTVIVNPQRRVDLGYILQKDLAKGAVWKYEWQTQPD